MDKVVAIMLTLVVLVMLALVALMISVPAIERDANMDPLRQDSTAITAQQKQLEARFKAVNADALKMV